MSRKLSMSLVSGILTLPLISTALFAHVTLETREARAGMSYKAVLRVPHGCDGSPTLKVRAQIPQGVIAVKPMPLRFITGGR